MFRRPSGAHTRPAKLGRWWGRHSVLVRLVAMAMAIAGCSIGATAWIAAANTSQSIQQQYSDDLATGTRIYDTVLGYAATHSSWDGAGATLAPLAAATGRQIAILSETNEVLYNSGQGAPTGAPTAVVNPLSVSAFPGLASAGGIDPRAVGPFQLNGSEAARTRTAADAAVACLSRYGIAASIRTLPSGRSIVDVISPGPTVALPPTASPAASVTPIEPFSEVVKERVPAACAPPALYVETATEAMARAQLADLFLGCLRTAGLAEVVLDTESDPRYLRIDYTSETPITPTNPAARPCLDSARRQQLASYVAPPAVLFLTGSVTATLGSGPSDQVKERIILSALAILVVAVGAAAVAAVPLVRPLHSLTVAAVRVGAGDRTARVRTRDTGQIGALTGAFNRMARDLETAERQRKQMVSDIAHELRTPLGNIRGWLEAAQDGVAPFNTELAQSLLDESMLLQHVIDDLQDLALAEAGELVFHPEPIDAAAMVRQVAAAHLAKAEAAGITITRRLSTVDPADGGREPAPPGAGQPGHQRRALHRRWRPGHPACRTHRGHPRHRGLRYRYRHPCPGPAARLRPLLAGRTVPQPGQRRQRSGPGDHPPPGRGPGRNHHRPQ